MLKNQKFLDPISIYDYIANLHERWIINYY